MKKVPEFRVCQVSVKPVVGWYKPLGKPFSHLHQAQKRLEELRLGSTEKLAIYREVEGQLPMFVEGDSPG